MEVKVDVERLQLLNDRINQTIEALNQVRTSVRGLSHTPGLPQQQQQIHPFAYGAQPTMPMAPMGHIGLQHTPGIPSQFGGWPVQAAQHALPFGQGIPAGYGYPGVPQQALPYGGLSHSPAVSPEHTLAAIQAANPARMAQTFPFMFYV